MIRTCLGMVLVVVAFGATAHPFHESQAEIDYSGECSCLEITVRVKAEEMEAALIRTQAPRLPLEDARMQEQLKAYMRQHFTVLDAAGKPVELQWIGLEIDSLGAWMYLQSVKVQLPLQLHNDVLLEHEVEQTNRVLFRANGGKQALSFSRDAPRVQWLGKTAQGDSPASR